MIDRDILIHLCAPMYELLKLRDSKRLQSMSDAALLERAKETVALQAGAPDWPYESLRRDGDHLVHWHISDISQSAPGYQAFGGERHIHFPACGCGEDGDLEWEATAIADDPVTCPHCLQLLTRSGALTPIRFREWL